MLLYSILQRISLLLSEFLLCQSRVRGRCRSGQGPVQGRKAAMASRVLAVGTATVRRPHKSHVASTASVPRAKAPKKQLLLRMGTPLGWPGVCGSQMPPLTRVQPLAHLGSLWRWNSSLPWRLRGHRESRRCFPSSNTSPWSTPATCSAQ